MGTTPPPTSSTPLLPSDYVLGAAGVLTAATAGTGLAGLLSQKIEIGLAVAIASLTWLGTWLHSKGH